MSATEKNTPGNTNTSAPGTTEGQQPSEPTKVAPPQSSNQQPPTPAAPQTENLMTREAAEAMVEKARKDEKSKVYGEVEKLKTKKEENETKIAQLQTDLDALRAGKTGELASIQTELSQLREKNAKLEKAIDVIADESAKQVVASDVRAKREKLIAGLPQELHDIVTGDTPEELEASANRAKKIHSTIFEDAKEKARAELGSQVPGPFAPNGSHRVNEAIVTPANKESLARLKGPAYQEAKQKLLEKAKQQAGLS